MLGDLKNEKVFDYFEQLSRIPRGSKHNEKIGKYLVNFAKEKGLSYAMDSVGNVVIRKPATLGFEKSDTVVIQGHMDMVCETAEGVKHDFTKEGLELVVDGDFIHANGTTLGADDGIALAYALAILESNQYKHPALECLFTVDEEIGMLGAAALDPSMITGKMIINVDSEEEGTLLSSCAGGMTAEIHFNPIYEHTRDTKYRIIVKGLLGGHSGTDIHKNRHNASNVLARVLGSIEEPICLVSMEGGKADNSITRKCIAVIACKNPMLLEKELLHYKNVLEKEYQASEPDFVMEYEQWNDGNEQAMSSSHSKNIIDFINLAPFGVQEMSGDMPGLVESSLNMGILEVSEGRCEMGFSIRSQQTEYKKYLYEKVDTLAKLLGGTCTMRGEYPSWDYNAQSKLRTIMTRVFVEQYKKEPTVTGIHAGLECGLFYDRIEGVDMVSIGADTLDIHSPNEKLSISSTRRVYRYLLKTLEALADE